jgi:aldehyde:ferredoxin oxidoreductase
LTGIAKCQCRKAAAQRTHIFCAMLVWHKLKQIAYLPRIDIVSFEKPEQVTQPEDYDPQQALEEELTRQQRREEVAKFQAQLDEAYEKEREEALYQPPPLIIRAYQTVYGHFPEGWEQAV